MMREVVIMYSGVATGVVTILMNPFNADFGNKIAIGWACGCIVMAIFFVAFLVEDIKAGLP